MRPATSGAAPLTARPLRWVRSLDGYRLGSHLRADSRSGIMHTARRRGPGLGAASGQRTSGPGRAGHHGSPGRLVQTDATMMFVSSALERTGRTRFLKAPLAS